MKASEVERSILRRYGCEFYDGIASEWAALPELVIPGIGTGGIDLFLQRGWRGRPGQVRHAIEIKISRSDFRKEIQKPSKRAGAVAVCHQFWFATPAGLVTVEEVPEECGLYEVRDDGRVVVAKKAPNRKDPLPIPEGAFVEVCRRESKLRERARNEARDNEGSHIPTLKAELATARQEAAKESVKRRMAEDRAKEILQLVAPMVDVPCRCGAKIKLTNLDCFTASPDHEALLVALFPHLAEPEF